MENLIQFLKAETLSPFPYVLSLCGSAITERTPRDIDFILYVSTEDLEESSRYLQGVLSSLRFDSSVSPMDALQMYAVKFLFEDRPVSVHIVSYFRLLEYACRAKDTAVYTEVDIVAYRLNYPAVYRKWILETRRISGDVSMWERLYAMVRDAMPVPELLAIFQWNIENTVHYCIEKWDNGEIARGILLFKVFREVLLYCYAANRQFYGTVKYVDRDLKAFQTEKELCNIAALLFRAINSDSTAQVMNLLEQITCYFQGGKEKGFSL